MLEGKRFRRGWLLPVVVALVAAMVGSFGLAPMFATADPAMTLDKQEIDVTVTELETGVTGTAYEYMSVNWDNDADQPRIPEYVFKDEVSGWMRTGKNRGGIRFLSSISAAEAGRLPNSGI